ncbi:MAG TPA: efflux RND transporter periplasmic adaptor subunit [Pseudolabrys sp.]|nr:efflux RND transporter periplasmic adaptor subunit [Pseudolabrys sp.]
MLSVSPKKLGIVLASLGTAFHLGRLGFVAFGNAQPHTLGSLSFPETASILIAGTALAGFIVGVGAGVAWNQVVGLPPKLRLAWSAALFAALVIVGFGAWKVLLSPVTVEVTRSEHDVAVQVFGLGTVEARVTSQIGFKIAGVLVDLHADVGDRVIKDAVLARLDDREQRAQVGRAKAAVEQSEASLQKSLASVEKAKANYTNAKNISQRRQKLVLSNVSSIEEAQTSQAAENAALADLDLATSDVSVAKAAISDARAQQQLQAATLDFHSLVAPYDAMVTARQKELGSALTAGQPVFTLIDPKSIWVLAYIDESKAGEIEVGQSAEIVLRSQPSRRIAAHVARIEPESDRINEERRIEIAFDRIPSNFNLGEQAEVYIATVRLGQALLVPEAAIQGLGSNRGTVWSIEDGTLRQREVTLGHRLLDGRYEIISGLPDGGAVVAPLRGGLRDGRAVKVIGGSKR